MGINRRDQGADRGASQGRCGPRLPAGPHPRRPGAAHRGVADAGPPRSRCGLRGAKCRDSAASESGHPEPAPQLIPRSYVDYNLRGTTRRDAGCTIAAVGSGRAKLAPPWVRPVATAVVVEIVTLGGTVLSPPGRARPIDALAVLLLVIAAGAVAFTQRWPVQALSASLLCTATYYALGYHTDSSFFIGLLVTGYRSGTSGARMRAAASLFPTSALFAAAARLGRPID